MTKTITPGNGMVITEDTTLAAGVYVLPDGIRIGAAGITLDGGDATIISGEKTGSAVSADGQNDLTIRNLNINGYYHGVRIENGTNITLENLTIRDTYEIDGIDTFLYLWKPVQEAYSGAILFNNITTGTIQNCDVQHQMNGILAYNSANLTVQHNNGSFNSGWGVYLSNTSDSRIEDNQLDFCNRVFRRDDGSVRVEADAAGLVMVVGSSRNRILRNSLLCGGDGIFLCGYEHPGNINPCNDNLFEDNDCRLSPNNAIEATFSQGNIFGRNDCSRSNYGFWMGYSSGNIIEGNTIEFSRWAGIAIEHGFDFTLRNNQIKDNGVGVRLFTRGGIVVNYYPGQHITYNIQIEGNHFERNARGIHAYTGDDSPDDASHHFVVRDNTFVDNRIGVQFGRVADCIVRENRFQRNVETDMRLAVDADVAVDQNDFEG